MSISTLESKHQATSKSEPDKRACENLASQDALWDRLQAFELDQTNSQFSFSERASKENGWRQSYTLRVIEEYKRFVFLAMKAGHIVCPSEDVDQVWHMHLTYTRSYWEELCGQVLDRPLHHGPTTGGQEEHIKYFKLYEKTKASYTQWFGHEPPADIWPSPERRFGEDLHYVRINASQHWIVPKFGWGSVAGAASLSLMLPFAQLVLNPLDLRGPQFLGLFFSLLALSLVATLAARWYFSQGDPDSESPAHDKLPDVGPLEAAWLQGGNGLAISCALVDLAQQDAIELHGREAVAGRNVETTSAKHRLSKLLLNTIQAMKPAGVKWTRLYRDAHVGLVGMRQTLEDRGLATTSGQRVWMGFVPCLLIGGLMVLGAFKIGAGLSRERPVGILIFGEIAAAGLLAVLLATLPRITAKGKRLLRKLKQATPEKLAEQNPSQSNPTDEVLLWGTALVGTAYLAATPYSGISILPTDAARSGMSSGGCATSGCGGDSGCGGGGCGGGCGGCGGCGG